jgi:hypothetical protein
LFDAYLVPKLLSHQLLPFGRSGDGLEELTRGVDLFLPLSVRHRQSAFPGGQSAGAVFFACSSCSCLSSFSIRFCFRFSLQPVCRRSELDGIQ